jgi:uncharacterized membrane protein
MTFLNATLLIGTAAGSLPLLIHLLQKNKRKPLQWSAMQFLFAQNIRQRRRLRIEQLLLLLVRISIPVLLALCMARPLLSSLRAPSKRLPTSLVILLDDSASMDCPTGASSAFTRAKSVTEKLLRNLPRGSEVALLGMSDPQVPWSEFTVSTDRALALLSERTSQTTEAHLKDSLDAATEQFSKAHLPTRRLVVISDFQKSNWSTQDAILREKAIQRLRALSLPPEIILCDTNAASIENVAVEAIHFSKLPVALGQKMRFRTTLHNYGKKPRSNLLVSWIFDGTTTTPTGCSIAPQESVQLLLEKTFTERGSHTVQVSIERDQFPADDIAWAHVNVSEPLSILLVNGSPSKEPMEGDTDFLQLALQPDLARKTREESFFQTDVVEPNTWSEKALLNAKVIVLANVPSLSNQRLSRLEAFVQKGGGLVVFTGPQIDADWYNKNLHRSGRGLIPARIDTLQNYKESSAQNPPSLILQSPSHPILEPFSGSDAPFHDLRIQSWFTLRTTASTDSSPQPNTVLALDDGSPLLIERRYGEGIVLQCAIPCSPNWSNLPTRPAFVPLMQKLVAYAASANSNPQNLFTGDSIIAPLPAKTSTASATIITPAGKSFPLPIQKKDDSAFVEYADTRLPGIYAVTIEGQPNQLFALNLPRSESDPEKLSAEALQTLAHEWGATLLKTEDSLELPPPQGGFGREIRTPLLWLVLALLFSESLLLQRFHSRKEHTA